MDRPTVLVVEDDDDISEALKDVLEDAGYAVVAARGGEEAIRYLRGAEELPGLILLDLMMPGMSGDQFREKQLGEDPRRASIPVLVLSADRLATARAQALRVQGCLLKPLGADQLLAAVGRILPLRPA